MKFLNFRTKKKKKKRFRRPEFQEKLQKARKYKRKAPVKSEKRSRAGWYLIGVILLIAVYFLFISRVFLVEKTVLLSDDLSTDVVEELLREMSSDRIYLVPSNHILVLSKKELTKRLRKKFPDVREITHFRRIFPDRLALDFELREPVYVWQTGEEYYYLDQEGVIYERVNSEIFSLENQVLLTDRTASLVEIGENLKIEKKLNFIDELQELWDENIRGLKYSSFSFPGTESVDVFVSTTAGFEVYFDLNREVRPQLENLSLLLTREIDPSTWPGLSYIDLRFSDIAYYCYKDAPCSPEYQAKLKAERELENEQEPSSS